jgi:hypothetical protein
MKSSYRVLRIHSPPRRPTKTQLKLVVTAPSALDAVSGMAIAFDQPVPT